jgi:two-component system, response regulator PdtaR
MTKHREKILVVDDDRLVLVTVAHGLADAGFEVIEADNGDDAILLARQHKPDLALLDIRMAGKSGFDVAEYLRDHGQVPFMFLSAFADEATVAKVKELGAVAYLIKPLDIRQIVPAVEAALAHVAGQRQAVAQALQAQRSDRLHEVSMAVGVLMHRHSVDSEQALQRLQRMAAAGKRDLAAQARDVLGAVEALGRSVGY